MKTRRITFNNDGFVLLAVLGFLAALLILVGAVSAPLLTDIQQSKLQRDRDQAMEIARAAAIMHISGKDTATLEGFSLAIESGSAASAPALTPATAATAPAAGVFTVTVAREEKTWRTVWRPTEAQSGKRVILVD